MAKRFCFIQGKASGIEWPFDHGPLHPTTLEFLVSKISDQYSNFAVQNQYPSLAIKSQKKGSGCSSLFNTKD